MKFSTLAFAFAVGASSALAARPPVLHDRELKKSGKSSSSSKECYDGLLPLFFGQCESWDISPRSTCEVSLQDRLILKTYADTEAYGERFSEDFCCEAGGVSLEGCCKKYYEYEICGDRRLEEDSEVKNAQRKLEEYPDNEACGDAGIVVRVPTDDPFVVDWYCCPKTDESSSSSKSKSKGKN